MNWRLYWRWYLAGVLFLSSALVWFVVWQVSPSGELTVAFLDIGQGDAVFIETPRGNQILFDGGPDRLVLERLSELMPFFDRSLDLVIASHFDADHIGGLVDVLERFPVSGFLAPAAETKTATAKRLATLVKEKGVKNLTASRGARLILDDGVSLEILSPVGPDLGGASNERSIVAKLSFGTSDFLLTGDAPQKIERALVAREGARLAAEVLKVGHHGSKTSTAPEFLAAVQPERAVISVGARNRYGHPAPEVLQTLAAAGVPVWRTDEDGTVIIKTDGRSLLTSASGGSF